jgi:hypothetical protein
MSYKRNGDSYLLDLEFEQAKRAAKKKKSLVSELLNNLEVECETPSSPFSIEAYMAGRIATLIGNAEEIRCEMKSRAKVHFKAIKEIRSQIAYAQLSLEKVSGWGIGYNTGIDVKRNHLERQLLQLRQDCRATELRAWHDLAGLRKEFLHAISEYKGAKRRGAVIE